MASVPLASDPQYLKSGLYAGCGSVSAYRFQLALPLSSLAAGDNQLQVYTTNNDRKRQVGMLSVQPQQPFGYMENAKLLNWDNRTISGWAISPAGEVAVKVMLDGREITATNTGISRADVAAVFKQWPGSERSGFAVGLPIPELKPGRYETQIKLTDQAGQSQLIEGPVIDNSRSFALVESKGQAIRQGKKNMLIGWVVAKSANASVQISAQGHAIATVPTNGLRTDVARIFRHWEYAQNSGLEHQVSFRKLPRGRYPLKLEFIDEDGVFQVSEGPIVYNDKPIGRVLSDKWQLVNPEKIEISAWIADEDGIANVELELNRGERQAPMQLIKQNLTYEQVRSKQELEIGVPAPLIERGSLYRGWIDAGEIPSGLNRVQVRVLDQSGAESLLPGPLVVIKENKAESCGGQPVRLYFPGDTQFWRKGATQLQNFLRLFNKGCVEVGMQSRVEYLRMTGGEEQDFQFDPDFPDRLRIRDEGTMLSTALNELLGYAQQWDIPLMVTLDGGPWADSVFPAPDVDLVDRLELDERNVQWNQFGRAEPDDALSNLPGSFGSPELARMMSLNLYNEQFLFYKKRNLSAAVKAIRDSSYVQAGGSVAINLDPDQYINPWFYKTQWYDYNPNTLRQFREWLFHEGPYSLVGKLSGRGYLRQMTLSDINQLADKNWQSSDQVDPPRKQLNYADPWHQIWTSFKRHLVALHYDELSIWAEQAGMPASNIYSSQTFIQTDVAETIYDLATGWPDEAGVSIAGAKPKRGHLGAILYGPASRDEGKSRSGGSMFHSIRKLDPHWGVVELNPATIEFPEWLADHQASYATVGNILNAGARFITPMWGSHIGDMVTYPDTFRSYDAFTGTPFEYQLVWWLLHRENIPAGALSYPFGNEMVASNDGWSVDEQSTLLSMPGYLQLEGENIIAIQSPELDRLPVPEGAYLRVSGEWCESTQFKAKIDLSDGSVRELNFKMKKNRFEARIPPLAEIHLDRISLMWDISVCNTGHENKITLDDVSLIRISSPVS